MKINLNDAANRHLVTSLVAMESEKEETQKGTVAAKHLRRIKKQHLKITESLDAMLEANERSQAGAKSRDWTP